MRPMRPTIPRVTVSTEDRMTKPTPTVRMRSLIEDVLAAVPPLLGLACLWAGSYGLVAACIVAWCVGIWMRCRDYDDMNIDSASSDHATTSST